MFVKQVARLVQLDDVKPNRSMFATGSEFCGMIKVKLGSGTDRRY
jgi:hypothetical protein